MLGVDRGLYFVGELGDNSRNNNNNNNNRTKKPNGNPSWVRFIQPIILRRGGYEKRQSQKFEGKSLRVGVSGLNNSYI